MRGSSVRLLWVAAAALMSLGSCALVDGEGDSDITVTVVRGIDLAPAEMKRAEEPVARYLEDSEVLVFVSEPRYSGSCPPTGEAEQTREGIVTLTIDDSLKGDCTADANRDTFLVQGLPDTPRRLVVRQGAEDDIKIDVELRADS